MAHSEQTARPCKGPAVTGWRVCRFHGAGGGHPSGKAHPSWKHGMRAQDWIRERRMLNELVREAREKPGIGWHRRRTVSATAWAVVDAFN